ncbi:MFS transporter [Paeniglutamicibacter gangotriensis]|uniref:Permease n=1 Tax=Paeniglutamicibacter gangotriensis Lz1y TaxID=1276920 RepID=M7NHS9_9MICC|nr:MFS transporter [Paeniglutamicibacter gangotriensis]EMQ98098.1 permease [Paeniglutamicibacter gangotriensis Lz1y]
MSLGRRYRRLWAGHAASNFGDGISYVAIPLLATALTTNPLLVAGLPMVYSAAKFLVVLPVGAVVDRMDRKKILGVSNLGRSLLLAVLAVLVATGTGSLPALYVVFTLIGLLETASDNSALAILPSLVDSKDLDRANSQISATQLVADEFIGPPLGGLLFAAAMALPLATTAGAYAAAAFLFLGVVGTFRPGRRPGPRRSLHREVAEGATWLARHPLLRSLAVISGLASIGYMMPFSILVLFVQDVLGLGSAGYGILLSVSALGGLGGAAVVAPLRRRIGYGATTAGSLLVGAASLLAIFLTDVPWVAGLFLATYILHAVIFSICVSSLRQRLVPDQLRGRVNAVSKLFGLAGLSVGAGLGGLLATAFDLAVPFLAGTVVFILCAAIAWPNLHRWERAATDHA